MNEDGVSSYFTLDDGSYQFLIVLEALLFEPYYPVDENDDPKELKKLSFTRKYLTTVFTDMQDRISRKDVEELQKVYKKTKGHISGSTRNTAIGVAGTGVAILATGGLAWVFAPAIAVTIVGGTVATGLSGAALTSYSLATIAGGSLATGGLGMAGGTAIITGGGALLGTLGGAGVSAATTVSLLPESGAVLTECCKLVTFSQVVLIDTCHRYDEVRGIRAHVRARIATVKRDIDEYRAVREKDKEKNKNRKAILKSAEKSLTYLERCEKLLSKLLSQSRAAYELNSSEASKSVPEIE